MVTKYSGYIHTPATRATGYVEDPNGSVVLASDYDALDEALNECIKNRDWFSDRLDAATAELARVKAESLRVVAITEDRSPINMDTMVRHIHIDGQVFRLERWEATR